MKKILALVAALLLILTPTAAAATPTPSVTFVTNTRVVAGKVVLVVTVTNAGETPVEVSLQTLYGDKVVAVAPGRSSSVAFSTRQVSIPAGTIYATYDLESQRIEYPAFPPTSP